MDPDPDEVLEADVFSFFVDAEGVVRIPEALRDTWFYIHADELEKALTAAYEAALMESVVHEED